MKRKKKLKQRNSSIRAAKTAQKKASRKRKQSSNKVMNQQKLATHSYQGIGVSQDEILDDFGTFLWEIFSYTPVKFKVVHDEIEYTFTTFFGGQCEFFSKNEVILDFVELGIKILRPVMIRVSGLRTPLKAHHFLNRAYVGVMVRAAPELAYVSPLTQELIIPIIEI